MERYVNEPLRTGSEDFRILATFPSALCGAECTFGWRCFTVAPEDDARVGSVECAQFHTTVS